VLITGSILEKMLASFFLLLAQWFPKWGVQRHDREEETRRKNGY